MRLPAVGSDLIAGAIQLFPHSPARCPLPFSGSSVSNTSLPSHGVVRPRPATLIVDVRPSERSEKEVWLARVALPRYSRNGRLGFNFILFASWSTPCASRRVARIAFSRLDCLRERQLRADGQACLRMQCRPPSDIGIGAVKPCIRDSGVLGARPLAVQVEWSRDVRRHEARRFVFFHMIFRRLLLIRPFCSSSPTRSPLLSECVTCPANDRAAVPAS